MKIVVFANQKGGEGKSALSSHAAFYAGEAGHRTLLADFDSQGNSTRTLLADVDDGALRSSALFSGRPLRGRPQAAAAQRVSVIVGDGSLLTLDENARVDESLPGTRLAELAGDYDLCIIDAPPTLGKRLRAALGAADAVVVPFQPARESIDGVGDLLRTIEAVRMRSNPRLAIAGFLANRVNRASRSDRELVALMAESVGDLLLPVQIAARTRIKDSLAAMHPVWHHMRGGSDRTAAAEMREAMAAVLERVL